MGCTRSRRTSSARRSPTRSNGARTMTLRRVSLLAALSVALVAAGCNSENLVTPPVPAYLGGAMFARYVSFGNSITAGFQSGGLSDSLQRLGYPVLLPKAIGTPFFYPSPNNPGGPPPIDSPFKQPPHRARDAPAPPR